MLFTFYQNTLAAIRQWLETAQLAVKPAPVPVRIRIDSFECRKQLTAQQQRALHLKYRAKNKYQL